MLIKSEDFFDPEDIGLFLAADGTVTTYIGNNQKGEISVTTTGKSVIPDVLGRFTFSVPKPETYIVFITSSPINLYATNKDETGFDVTSQLSEITSATQYTFQYLVEDIITEP